MAALLKCAEVYPGTLSRLFTASPLRRQATFLVLSELDLDCPQDLARRLSGLDDGHLLDNSHPLAPVIDILLHRRVRDIVRAFHPTSTGLVTALGKLGRESLAVEDYHTLIELHTKPEHRSRVRLLRHIPHIPKQAIAILALMEPPYLTLPLLKRLQSGEEVTDFRRSIVLIKQVVAHVTDQNLLASLSALKDETTLGQWVTGWLSRETTFWMPPPITDDHDLIYLNGAAAMRDAGRRFRNCLAEKTTFCVLGRSAYLEYYPIPVIIELQTLDRGYVLERLYGPGNAGVDSETAHAIIKKLKTVGILVPARDAQALPFNRVARLAHFFDFARRPRLVRWLN